MGPTPGHSGRELAAACAYGNRRLLRWEDAADVSTVDASLRPVIEEVLRQIAEPAIVRLGEGQDGHINVAYASPTEVRRTTGREHAVAGTTIDWDDSGLIRSARILLATDVREDRLAGVLAHELGHALGLAHVDRDDSIMHPRGAMGSGDISVWGGADRVALAFCNSEPAGTRQVAMRRAARRIVSTTE